ncbi:uncharacterized protein M6B38_277275 [Iris pallida]|uniref:Uncharacterized protein n=1 Tax=Iris pallida TaxID=29817 RepID=A0AAX6I311_IRIPA|nr:uncharacterized protein M6B38_277275 [Iris pallida]
MYISARCSVDCPTRNGRNLADFVSLSTITQMTLLPFCVLGSPDTKSIVICSHFHSGTGSGCSSPAVRWCSAFTCWHTKHFETNLAISRFIPCHQKFCLRSLYIFVLPGGMEY